MSKGVRFDSRWPTIWHQKPGPIIMLQTEARELRCQEHDQQMELQGSFCKRENVFIRIYAHWYKSFGKQHVVPVACGYVKLWVAHAPVMPRTFSRQPQISDPDMHHGTCATHVPWCMPELLTSGFLWSRENVPGACAMCNFTYLVRGPCMEGQYHRLTFL